MKYFAVILLSVISLFSSACVASKVALSPEQAKQLKGRSYGTTRHSAPGFMAMTVAKAGLGSIGTMAMLAEGNAIIRENQVEDPAAGIAGSLEKSLIAKYGGKAGNGPVTVSSEKTSEVAKSFPQADFILDAQTLGWGCIYHPFMWRSYRVLYGVRLRLIERATGRVVAEDTFQRQLDTIPFHHYSQLSENNAAILKQELRDAAAAATAHFKHETLKL